MGENLIHIFNIPITSLPKKDILKHIEKYLNGRAANGVKTALKPYVITTPNPEHVVYAQTHNVFRKILIWSDIAVPDGAGVVWAARFLGYKPRLSRISGRELMENLVALSAEKVVRVGLIGGQSGVALKALECLQRTYPGLIGWADGGMEVPMSFKPVVGGIRRLDNLGDLKEKTKDHQADEDLAQDVMIQVGVDILPEVERLAERVVRENTRFVFLAFGAPRQEYIAYVLAQSLKRRKFGPVVIMVVGGAFDVFSGRLKKTPKFIERYSLEWLWRLFQEPWRWKRQMSLIHFVWLVIKEKIRGN